MGRKFHTLKLRVAQASANKAREVTSKRRLTDPTIGRVSGKVDPCI